VSETQTTTTNMERPPLMLRAAIRAVKEAVSVERYLFDRGEQVEGNRVRCIVHGGDNPTSFAVYPEERRWWCFRCNQGGDVIDLCRAVEGGELWEAMISLAQQYDVTLPDRGDQWREWQDVKARVRTSVKKRLARTYQRCLTRLYTPLFLVRGESEEESLQELEGLAVDLWPHCLDLAGRRLYGE
jgi:DNA primase